MSNKSSDFSVLIVGPDLTLEGGVANIYRSLKWDRSDNTTYFAVTPSKRKRNILFVPRMLSGYLRCIHKVQVVQINPSLDFRAVVRDGVLLLIAKSFNKKVIVFFHGWDDNFADRLMANNLYKKVFAFVFSKANAFCTLSALFTRKLNDLGVRTNRVFELPTVADDSFIQVKTFRKTEHHQIHILFLSRFDENKGVDIVVKAFEQLQVHSPGRFRLTLAGNGPLLNYYKEKFRLAPISQIEVPGFVEGERKHRLLEDADIMLLPSKSEGLPCAILEGMLYGLVIVSRPIGGIPDWVKQNENGLLIESLDPMEYAKAIQQLAENRPLLERIAVTNKVVAAQNFTPARVKQRMMEIHRIVNE